MNTENIISKFERIGARAKVVPVPSQHQSLFRNLRVDIKTDRKGEYFELILPKDVKEIEVLDVQPKIRHLLLMERDGLDKNKLLCGHDERHWFVAGVPNKAPVGTVMQAMTSLQPMVVRSEVDRKGVAGAMRNRRKNNAFLRQGEWFFVPRPDFTVPDKLILKNEPLRRSDSGKPHWMEYCCRLGGESVYVNRLYPNGLTYEEYREVVSDPVAARHGEWRVMSRRAEVFAFGRIRHADHATIDLQGWHQVFMNTENESAAMINVAFLD